MNAFDQRCSALRSLLRHVKQRLVMLHQMLGAVEARHRAGRDPAARAERDEAVEDRLVALAEQPLVVVGPDAEIERAIAAPGIVVDDVAHQDQAGAVTRIARHRVGIEHHRKAMSVGDAGEDRDHLVVAFERVNIDGAAAARKPRHAGIPDEILHARVREHVGQFLLRHPQRLDGEEPVEQPLDVGIRRRDVIAIARQALCSLRSLPFRRRRNELLISAAGAAPGAIASSGQSLTEGCFGSSAIGFGRSRQRRGCWVSARTSAAARSRDSRKQRIEVGSALRRRQNPGPTAPC